MKPGGGKAKGSSFERQICKALSLWVSNGEREDLYWRSAMSGGRATVGRRAGKDLAKHAGDISATSRDGHKLTNHFFIECKFVRDLGIANFVYMKPSTIRRFWDVAVEQANDHDLAPMLIAKENNGPVIVVISGKEARGFEWAKEAATARIALDLKRNATIIDFNQMLAQPFTIRWRA